MPSRITMNRVRLTVCVRWAYFPGEISQLSNIDPPTPLGGASNYTYLFMLSRVHAVKNHQRSSTVQEERLAKEGRHHLLLLHKQEHDQRHCRITISVHKYGYVWHGHMFGEIYTPLFEELFKFIVHRVLKYVYWNYQYSTKSFTSSIPWQRLRCCSAAVCLPKWRDFFTCGLTVYNTDTKSGRAFNFCIPVL